ncbi:outer membrane lipoprotein-sorting protein [Panacagrimonas perspica]|uniref:Outer membrane lipoprotein-sorting protein n=1 Tax=Panacagrimonas perspica TaxID=381431 RepID=A0A4S3K050_9GAMM|nr:outer membrane lipoprotein-sorting protein [Panacagrimonas perspica]TDU32127.1 outer membrane lipoprotein-sorting protein [Panacagrimonas perspica]THD01168.1 hypothetical protein B1810_21515 [Panacagrimonas perspica]
MRILLAGAALAMAVSAPLVVAADEAAKVLECMQANVPTSLRVQEVEFSTSDRSGTASTLKGRLYAERELAPDGSRLVRAMLLLSAPPNLSGAAYLIREKDGDLRDGMYVYLPSVKRVRRVTGSIADGGLMGTSFSYADFKQLQNTFGGARTTYEGGGEIDKRPTHVLAFRPADTTKGGYTLVRTWVDTQTCVPLKAEFHEGKDVRKRLVSPIATLKQVDAYWYASVIEMHDLKQDLHTTLRVFAVKPGGDISGGFFDPKTFYQR